MKKCLIVILLVNNFVDAVSTTTVYNKSQHNIYVIFQAWGCFGMSPGRGAETTRACNYEIVKPGNEKTYHWKWGQTGKKIFILAPMMMTQQQIASHAYYNLSSDAKDRVNFPDDFPEVGKDTLWWSQAQDLTEFPFSELFQGMY